MAQDSLAGPVVFLSGGTHGNWREQVFEALSGVRYHDPSTLSSLPSMDEIANTERAWLDDSDVVFFYFEASNPSGLGSAFEIGYAVAKDIPVIFVDEKETSHTEWLGVHCTYVTSSLSDGLEALRRLLDPDYPPVT